MDSCRKCKIELTSSSWYPSDRKKRNYICISCVKAYTKEHYRKNQAYYYQKYKEDKRAIRKRIINLLGGKCVNSECAVPGGMRDIRALQIDHVYGTGKEERSRYKNWYQYYLLIQRKIRAGSDDYQVLCANCNTIKRHRLKEWRMKST